MATALLSASQMVAVFALTMMASYTLPWDEGLKHTATLTQSFITAMRTIGDPDTCDLSTFSQDEIRMHCVIPRTSDGVDAVAFLVYTAFFFVVNWGVRLFVVEPIARVLLVTNPKASPRRKLHQQTKVEKFSQSAMEQLFYGAFTVFGAIILSTQIWAWPSDLWYKGCLETHPSPHPSSLGVEVGVHSYMTKALAAYYIMYAARYFQGFLSVLVEHRRKDFYQMVTHHLVTFSVVALSYTVSAYTCVYANAAARA